jgi:flagellar protein FlbD
MIEITDLKGHSRYINAEMIESVEANPDTQVVLSNGHRFYAREKPVVIVERVIAYRRQCNVPPVLTGGNKSEGNSGLES